jgi:hypothetical protein
VLKPGLWEATVSAPDAPLGSFELVQRFRIGGAGQ